MPRRIIPKWILAAVGKTPTLSEDGAVSLDSHDDIFPFKKELQTDRASADAEVPGNADEPVAVQCGDRRASTRVIAEHVSQGDLPAMAKNESSLPKTKGRTSMLERMFTRNAKHPEATSSSEKPILRKRDSQDSFSDQSQTIIIFDWDDTLFPTEYICKEKLDLRKALSAHRLPKSEKRDIGNSLAKCAHNAAKLLKTAALCGEVVVVTLAKSPWVTDACKNFYPGIGKLLDTLGIRIVYAQQHEAIDYNKDEMMGTVEYWSRIKGEAITHELNRFYSKYEGQSWKNIISIGDSDFERFGTMQATSEYVQKVRTLCASSKPDLAREESVLRETADALLSTTDAAAPDAAAAATITSKIAFESEAVSVNGHIHKVRTKTFKMLDAPKVEELTVQLDLVQRWLAPMVKLDSSFNVDLQSLDDIAKLQAIEHSLTKTPEQDAPDLT
eukprot:TRINITY_DN93739_c0_g1_i1.p1 TRINITY_DN93739_c0_g1~~TRINITY_DN93739_c0_g1_i1.p1  ORF type:complete len:443 (-),score=76.37 TRINITY_DN93739_c0_g1_i1:364-1692(-)